MKQYQAAKARYPQHLLFFRIGDFYELFYDDAKTAARVLGLTLTARHKGADPIPLAGVPAHTAEQYLARLLRMGFSVAVCDQTEDASQAKGLVKREITRVVTPGTVLEENLLDARKPNRIVAILPQGAAGASPAHATRAGAPGAPWGQKFGLAVADLAGGTIHIQELSGETALRSEITRLAPSEILLPEDPPRPLGQKAPSLLPQGMTDGLAISRLKPAAFDLREALDRLLARFSQNGRDKQAVAQLKSLAKSLPLATAAAGALTGYIEETFAGGKVMLSAPQTFDPEQYMILGESAIRSLELLQTISHGSPEGSLFWSIDRTCTGPGARLLREWMIRPLRQLDPLRARHDAVARLIEDFELRAAVRDKLKHLADLERISARLVAGKATPRDLLALRDSLLLLPELHRQLEGTGLLSGSDGETGGRADGERSDAGGGRQEAGAHQYRDRKGAAAIPSPLEGEGRHERSECGVRGQEADEPSSLQQRSTGQHGDVLPSPLRGGAGGGVPGDAGLLSTIRTHLTGFDPLADLIATQLDETCSNIITDGGLIKPGIDAELDRLRAISSGGKEWIASFQAAEAARSGIHSLKIGYNRVFGYYIEISKANQHLVPKDYERRQTLTNAERYTTPELKAREAEVLGAEEKICALEQKLFLALRENVAQSAECLHATGRALAQLDALCSLAEVAQRKNHVRPVLSNSGRLCFEQMRHPVLEDTLPKGQLVPNDVALQSPLNGVGRASVPAGAAADGGQGRPPHPQILLLTGPNMAGKSTYIRATALCSILAQMGAFVPAEKAELGLVDRIFTRVGAADDLSGGRSTFMVEMSEVAEILAGCSDRSLVILDEVGRGTSTYDGVSLAWSIVEHLHQGSARPRTLFATHYHELSALEDELPRVKNASASVKEWQGEITFLHRIVTGPSERSFGLHVARLAGLPAPVIDRAKAILIELEAEAANRVDNVTDGGAQIGSSSTAQESAGGAGLRAGGSAGLRAGRSHRKPSASDGQLHLFEPTPEEIDPAVQELLTELRATDPHDLTPVQALSALDKLVRKAKGE
ncbi:MAG TPA: DNA mismatch repair protein MutS [Planctomycetota bacterium]